MSKVPLIGKQYSDISLKHFNNIKNKICIVRNCGGLGDIINMRMIFADIKTQYPHFNITWAVPNNYFAAADFHPFVDQVIASSDVNQKNYMQVYNLTNACTRYEWSKGKDNDKNRADIWSEHIGLKLNTYKTFMPAYKKEKETIKEKLTSFGYKDSQKIVILAPKSAIGVKNLTFEHMLCIKKICKDFFPVILHHHPILEFVNLKLPTLCGLNLKEAMAAVDLAAAVIATDTGLLHVAGAYGKPSLGIFSYTNGAIISKYYESIHVIQGKYIHEGHYCGPCNNFSNCKVDKHAQSKPCLTEINDFMIEEGWQKTLEKYANHINKLIL